MNLPRCFYFGCIGGSGHYLWNSLGGRCWSGHTLPFRESILDSGLLDHHTPQVEGVMRRVIIAGWTVVTFWDRSVDTRSGSNSAFVLEGTHETQAVITEARRQFPQVFDRFRFSLHEDLLEEQAAEKGEKGGGS